MNLYGDEDGLAGLVVSVVSLLVVHQNEVYNLRVIWILIKPYDYGAYNCFVIAVATQVELF